MQVHRYWALASSSTIHTMTQISVSSRLILAGNTTKVGKHAMLESTSISLRLLDSKLCLQQMAPV